MSDRNEEKERSPAYDVKNIDEEEKRIGVVDATRIITPTVIRLALKILEERTFLEPYIAERIYYETCESVGINQTY
ncbi:MAG: hypothetical protein IJW18_08555 [Lachnospiraceae bacterium]|nr:hypothetical protein [Lachnospiraceae bacterium]